MFAALAVILAVTIPPAPRDFIADQAGILNDKRDILVMQAGAQVKGVNLGILTVSELDDEPRAVAIRTLNYWNMTPDSVLLLISMNPRKVALDRLQDHHCSGLCNNTPEESHDQVMDQVNAALATMEPTETKL